MTAPLTGFERLLLDALVEELRERGLQKKPDALRHALDRLAQVEKRAEALELDNERLRSLIYRQACGLCGINPAAGFATIGDTQYCHEGESPTCYELATTKAAPTSEYLRQLNDVSRVRVVAAGGDDA